MALALAHATQRGFRMEFLRSCKTTITLTWSAWCRTSSRQNLSCHLGASVGAGTSHKGCAAPCNGNSVRMHNENDNSFYNSATAKQISFQRPPEIQRNENWRRREQPCDAHGSACYVKLQAFVLGHFKGCIKQSDSVALYTANRAHKNVLNFF